MKHWPAYLRAAESGRLRKAAEEAVAVLTSCTLCPRRCMVDRVAGEKGVCRIGRQAVVASYGPHFGEESVLVGRRGSGSLFFSGCNLLCVFCQNYDISHTPYGEVASGGRLAEMMMELQLSGCPNVNLITPSHVVPQILEALIHAVEMGLEIPLVYNSSGYDSVETLKLLDGIVDIYMPDFKFWSPEVAKRTCNAPDYPKAARAAIREMHRQVGDLVPGKDGVARRGLLVRHLVMPVDQAGSREVMRFLATEISRDTFVNIMDQYRPFGTARDYPELDRGISRLEYEAVLWAAEEEGLHRFDRPRRF